MTLPFGANIDIRDMVRYKNVMKEHDLGPNEEILTFERGEDAPFGGCVSFHPGAHAHRFDSPVAAPMSAVPLLP